MFAYTPRRSFLGILALCGLTIGTASSALAGRLSMEVNGFTSPPVGYLEFCRTTPEECASQGAAAAPQLSGARWHDLQEVNTFVNRIVIPATDPEFYQSEERWALPETYGDCEDYVLLKRKWLIERGWPTSSLLITVVFDEVGDGHAVLLALTSRGELVLDNKTDDIQPWHQTAYRYVKRQSRSDPNRWVSVGDPRWSAQSTAAPR
jgi:predicted transglutaminase-like cysteine proteinase